MTEWQLGVNAFQDGRLREAVDRLRAAAADHERTVTQAARLQTYAYLGAGLYALGDADGAAEAFADAIRLSIGKAPLALAINLANAYIASGQRQQAAQTLINALNDNPGAMEAKMLLERLQSRAETLPLTGTIFGETPQSVKRYMETLSFSTVAGGYSPEQVSAALSQVSHYIDVLCNRLADHDHVISQYMAEIDRLRQTEEALIGNLMQTRQELDQVRRSAGDATNEEVADSGTVDVNLTPLEKLFQKKN